MNLLQSLTNGETTKALSTFVTRWVVPLFILFNIIGWLGLAQREADRSSTQASYDDTSHLGRSVWRAWLAGIVAALAGVWFIAELCEPYLKGCYPPLWLILVGSGLLGATLGVARGLLPHDPRFRRLSAKTRRITLSLLVLCAVACSGICGALYYDEWTAPRNPIALFYICMLVGYVVISFLEVGK
jgi:hypothetical protein